jgi:uncharacterized protein YraI
MSQATRESFLRYVDEIAAEDPGYQLGHDGSDGKCDCIGLIIGAIRRSGGTWDGTHGTNYAARNEMEYLLPVTDAYDLGVGEVVYKAAMPGQTSYALPSRYKGDPDQRDYYHIGVVRSVNPLRIVHCTSPGGIKEDTKMGNWTHRGWLTKIGREGEETPMTNTETATVVAHSGSTVRMRATPSTTERLYWDVPIGTVVPVSGHQDGWSRVAYGGRVGWMQDKYLLTAGAAPVQPQEGGETVTLTLPRDVAQALREALQGILGWG